MVNRYVMKLEHDLFIDCLAYEWEVGIARWLTRINPYPRSMRVVLGFDDL